MRITALGQNSAHTDHDHMVLLGISKSLARCVGTIQIIHTVILFGATNLDYTKL